MSNPLSPRVRKYDRKHDIESIIDLSRLCECIRKRTKKQKDVEKYFK